MNSSMAFRRGRIGSNSTICNQPLCWLQRLCAVGLHIIGSQSHGYPSAASTDAVLLHNLITSFPRTQRIQCIVSFGDQENFNHWTDLTTREKIQHEPCYMGCRAALLKWSSGRISAQLPPQIAARISANCFVGGPNRRRFGNGSLPC